MQQYADIYSLQSSFVVSKYLHTVASVGFLFTLNYDARNNELKNGFFQNTVLKRFAGTHNHALARISPFETLNQNTVLRQMSKKNIGYVRITGSIPVGVIGIFH